MSDTNRIIFFSHSKKLINLDLQSSCEIDEEGNLVFTSVSGYTAVIEDGNEIAWFIDTVAPSIREY